MQGTGEEILNCWCLYKSTFQSDRKISFVTSWIEKAGPAGAAGFNNLCNPRPVSIEAMEIDTRYEVHIPGIAVMATVKASDIDLGTAKDLALQFIATVRERAVKCRNAPEGIETVTDQGNNSANCIRDIKRLKELELKQWDINRQVEFLNHAPVTVAVARDSLSYFSKLTAAVKEHEETGRYNGNLYTEVNRLQNDPVYRVYLAKKHGVNPDFPLLKIVRSIRNLYADQIDYLNKAPEFLVHYKGDLSRIHAEIGQLHRAIEQRECAGRYDAGSCDLSGDWLITEWDNEENVKYATSWTFIPNGKGRYTAFNNRTGARAEAEIFQRTVILKNGNDGRMFNLKFSLKEDCNNSILSETYTEGTFKELAFFQRKLPASGSYTEDMLYDISYQENRYRGLYKKEMDNGQPIDVFYFRVLHPAGYQVEQDGKKLWGRFVRKPSADYSNQLVVEWWYVDWFPENNKWVQKEKKLESPVQPR